MSPPPFTVVISSYNHARFLPCMLAQARPRCGRRRRAPDDKVAGA
jgi:hypothetical protein